MNHKKIWGRTVVLTMITWIILSLVMWYKRFFITICIAEAGVKCPSGLELFASFSIRIIPFFIILFAIISYIIEYYKLKAKGLNIDHLRVWLITIISSAVIWVIIYLAGLKAGYFRVMCFQGPCPLQLEVYLQYSKLLLPIIILLLAGINYLIEYFLERKKQQ
ncbi:MAG: hypothetical protein AABW73_04300 [Nanoarchaeota archaeon]